jgi:hypothetical protein
MAEAKTPPILYTAESAAATDDRHRCPEGPLSFMEEALWSMARQNPLFCGYNVMLTVRLRGSLNVTALEQAFNGIIGRHEILRTTFELRHGRPMRVINPYRPFRLDATDLRGVRATDRENTLRELATAEFNAPFDIAEGPLLRVKLLQIGSEDHALLLTMHHIISDASSMGLLARELGIRYGAYCRAMPVSLPELTMQYADYAASQRQSITGAVLDDLLLYWKRQLKGLPKQLRLPADHERIHPVLRSASSSFTIPTEDVRKLKALSLEEGVTLFTTLLAAFQLFLYKLTRDADIVIAVPTSDRAKPELLNLLGLFLNFLVLRTDLSGQLTFRDLMQKTFDVCLSAYQYKDVPHALLKTTLQSGISSAQGRLYQVMFNMVDGEGLDINLPGLKCDPYPCGGHSPMSLDLAMAIGEHDGVLFGTLLYNPEMFEASRVPQWAQTYVGLIAEVLRAPNQMLEDYSLALTLDNAAEGHC